MQQSHYCQQGCLWMLSRSASLVGISKCKHKCDAQKRRQIPSSWATIGPPPPQARLRKQARKMLGQERMRLQAGHVFDGAFAAKLQARHAVGGSLNWRWGWNSKAKMRGDVHSTVSLTHCRKTRRPNGNLTCSKGKSCILKIASEPL